MNTYWAEIGIDSRLYKADFKNKKRKHSSLKSRLTPATLTYIKDRFGLSSLTDKDALKKLIKDDNKSAIDIYIITRARGSFNNKKIKEYYQKNLRNGNTTDLLYCLLRLYFEKKEVLKNIFYATLLETKSGKLDSYALNSAGRLTVRNLDSLDERGAQSAVRSVLKTKVQKDKINVWFVLKEEGVVNIFVYKQTKIRAKIPNPSTKRYRFFAMAKPIIIQFSNGGKNVAIFSKEKETTLKMAKGVICTLSDKEVDDPTIFYDKQLPRNSKNIIDKFIDGITKQQNDDFTLEYVNFMTKHDPELSISKKSQPIGTLLAEITKNHTDNGLNANNIVEFGVVFKNKSFRIFIPKNTDGSYGVQYSSKADFDTRTAFEAALKGTYNVGASKRG